MSQVKNIVEEESRIIYTIEDNTASIKALKYKDTEGKFYSYSSRRSYSKNYKLENLITRHAVENIIFHVSSFGNETEF